MALPIPAKLPGAEDDYIYIDPEYEPRPFGFKYTIADKLMGLRQAHVQESDGKVVTGSYSYVRPDGILMTVRYTADENGYHPIVTEEAAPGLVNMDPEGDSSFSIKLPDTEEFGVHLSNQEYLVIKERLAQQKAERQSRSWARQGDIIGDIQGDIIGDSQEDIFGARQGDIIGDRQEDTMYDELDELQLQDFLD